MSFPFEPTQKTKAAFNQAAQNAQDSSAEAARRAQLEGKMREDFTAAHEGPREKIAEPRLELTLTPHGEVAQEVHTEIDKEAIARNKEKDAQMQAYRAVEIGTARKFNTRSLAPTEFRSQQPPEVFRAARGRHDREGGVEHAR